MFVMFKTFFPDYNSWNVFACYSEGMGSVVVQVGAS